MGNEPDGQADLNYFFPYLEWCDRGRSFDATLTAAWFTHRDIYHGDDKVAMWDEAAAAVDLRLTTARRNLPGLEAYGPTALVMPPVDADKFQPVPGRALSDKPVVGVSGYVYQGGRKGEELVEKLGKERTDLYVIASGKGWPVDDCQERHWDNLHVFYQCLDVLLCTSHLEGVPYPPLEALACGVPVVVPRDVGMLDDLPDNVPGIARYDAGDYDGMVAALHTVLDGEHDPAILRDTVSGYTLSAWRDDHERAFEDLLWPPREPENLSAPLPVNRGVYCVAFGDPSRGMARKLVASIRKHMPTVETCVASDAPLDAGEDVWLEHDDVDIGGRVAKIRMCDLAPPAWQYVLYLDADTEVVADVSVIFDWLVDGWELVICKNPSKYHVLGMMARPDNKEETTATFKELGSRDLLQLNGGVMAFRRNERVCRFFELWMEEWQRWGKRDQAALHRALWRQPLRVLVLGNEFNTVTRYDDPAITAGILHYPTAARRWQGRIEGRLDSEEAWEAVTA
jgi:hypothetical protein